MLSYNTRFFSHHECSILGVRCVRGSFRDGHLDHRFRGSRARGGTVLERSRVLGFHAGLGTTRSGFMFTPRGVIDSSMQGGPSEGQ